MFFIKIIKNKQETVHQCDSYDCYPLEDGKLRLDIKRGSKSIYEFVEGRYENSVFIMNENGKTIDKKSWSDR